MIDSHCFIWVASRILRESFEITRGILADFSKNSRRTLEDLRRILEATRNQYRLKLPGNQKKDISVLYSKNFTVFEDFTLTLQQVILARSYSRVTCSR